MKRESACLIGFIVLGTTTCHRACHIELEYNNNEDRRHTYLDGVSVVFDSYNYSERTRCLNSNKPGAQLLINCSHLGKGKYCKQLHVFHFACLGLVEIDYSRFQKDDWLQEFSDVLHAYHKLKNEFWRNAHILIFWQILK